MSNDEIKQLRAMGGDVMVSFGGAANAPLAAACTDTTNLKNQYKTYAAKWWSRGFALDTEVKNDWDTPWTLFN